MKKRKCYCATNGKLDDALLVDEVVFRTINEALSYERATWFHRPKTVMRIYEIEARVIHGFEIGPDGECPDLELRKRSR